MNKHNFIYFIKNFRSNNTYNEDVFLLKLLCLRRVFRPQTCTCTLINKLLIILYYYFSHIFYFFFFNVHANFHRNPPLRKRDICIVSIIPNKPRTVVCFKDSRTRIVSYTLVTLYIAVLKGWFKVKDECICILCEGNNVNKRQLTCLHPLSSLYFTFRSYLIYLLFDMVLANSEIHITYIFKGQLTMMYM